MLHPYSSAPKGINDNARLKIHFERLHLYFDVLRMLFRIAGDISLITASSSSSTTPWANLLASHPCIQSLLGTTLEYRTMRTVRIRLRSSTSQQTFTARAGIRSCRTFGVYTPR